MASLQAEVERQMMSQLKKQNVVINLFRGSNPHIIVHKFYHIYDINIEILSIAEHLKINVYYFVSYVESSKELKKNHEHTSTKIMCHRLCQFIYKVVLKSLSTGAMLSTFNNKASE